MTSPDVAPREFGPVSRCRIDLPTGQVVVKGGDGDVASVAVRVIGGVGRGEPAASDVPITISHQDGALSIRPAAPMAVRGLVSAAWHPEVSVELSLPRDAELTIGTTDAEVRVRGCRGGQSIRSVVGDVRVDQASGRVDVRTVAGSASISGDSVDVEAVTTSGRIRLAADRIDSFRLRSVSGGIEVAGGIAPNPGSRIDSLSGDISVTTSGGVTLVPRTVSGRIIADAGARREAHRGMTALSVGDGTTEVEVRSVSGDIRLCGRSRSEPRAEGAPPTDADRGPSTGDPMLEALEALARGDISVEEADHRLEVLHG